MATKPTIATSPTSSSQIGDHFWNKVFDIYNVAVRIKHRPDQITGRWRLIKEQVGKFNSIYKKYDDDRRSGESDAQVMEQARQAYTLEMGGKFTMYEAWTILRDRPKFLSFIGVDGMVIKKKRISCMIKSSDEDQALVNLDEEEPLDTELFGPDIIPRPPPPQQSRKRKRHEHRDPRMRPHLFQVHRLGLTSRTTWKLQTSVY
uniref:uncharacterized protein LOC122596929 n=1 Tax=Erigeron canadensis TaxID=72917 RepID=UPI001CB91781|nr:uncharacterized protein LOC122596929 [Erigeron canadensis]